MALWKILLSNNKKLNELSLASRKWYEDILSENATAERMKILLTEEI